MDEMLAAVAERAVRDFAHVRTAALCSELP